MAGIRTDLVPKHVDGPSLVAAASGLMLLPENASRLVRLHRLAALGMALGDCGARAASPSAIRSILKQDDVGGPHVVRLADPYSEVLVQTVNFYGGSYLVSPGTGEHTVADLESMMDAAFRERWMPDDLHHVSRQLIRGLLTVSDRVLRRAGLARGTMPGVSSRTPIEVPSAKRLKQLTDAAFISNAELYGADGWLRMVVDTFALDPGQLPDPCDADIVDDRLYVTPFLRLTDGYRVVVPLDLSITIRFHLLRFMRQEGLLGEFGKRYRAAAFRRLERLLPRESQPILLEQSDSMTRYLVRIDSRRDLHAIVATDPLDDWQLEVRGRYETQEVLAQIAELISPDKRATYSSATELLHLVINDGPRSGAFWGVPDVDGSDPVMIARSDDVEVILHQEPDGLVGLLLFAQAIERMPGESFATDVLDQFSTYIEKEKSFYLTDDAPAFLTIFQVGDGLQPRKKFSSETDRHGVIAPRPGRPVLQVRRRYNRDAPEIFIIEPTSSYIGYVVEHGDQEVFITLDPAQVEFAGVEVNLLECVAFWVRECFIRLEVKAADPKTELVLTLSDLESWKRVRQWSTTHPAVQASPIESGVKLQFTDTFVSLLQHASNKAERALVGVLLADVFGVARLNLDACLDTVIPTGSKRMLTAFDQNGSPDMLAAALPRPLTGHAQIAAQILDELGEWLRRTDGGGFTSGTLEGARRRQALNAAVDHLFELLEAEISTYDRRALLNFLVAQNEALLHHARINGIMLESRLACFGEHSHTVSELVQDRNENSRAQRANRFLIEYVSARPPSGSRSGNVLDYFRLIGLAMEIGERGTTSDFLKYELADFGVSILDSGRLGVSRGDPVIRALEEYSENAGARAVRAALGGERSRHPDEFDVTGFLDHSASAMRAEFGFTLAELREVCGGLLDLATADGVTRIKRGQVVARVAVDRGLTTDVVATVLEGITLSERASFLEIGADAYPWRYCRDKSYIRRPLVLQGDDLVFGFRSVYRLGLYWVENLLSGRLQSRAKTKAMQTLISGVRRGINDAFALSVAAKLQDLGMTTLTSVKKIDGNRIAEVDGSELGDIDILAIHADTRSIVAVEAKDFEIARTPAEMANELEKLFRGTSRKKSTIKLHGRRIEWLSTHVAEVVRHFGMDGAKGPWRVVGAVVTSEPLVTPLVSSSPFPVIAFDDLGFDSLDLTRNPGRLAVTKKRRQRR